MDQAERMTLKVKVGSVFTPGAPINQQDLFAGRTEQVNDVLNATLQPGRHVVMFGERGTGKTSLARVISHIVVSTGYKNLDCGTINCDSTDDFSSLWRKVFREISMVIASREAGFTGAITSERASLDTYLPDRPLRPDDVRYMLSKLSASTLIIIDEIDRLTDADAKTQLADTIKNLSDHSSGATLLLVGVADSVEQLIAEHQSIERALVQVPMPRMSALELMQILDKGWAAAGMVAEPGVKSWIARLSQGLPHYTHSLGLYASFHAIEDGRATVTAQDVLQATRKTVEKSHTIRTAYNKAISSPQKQNLYAHVLRACALAETDELGYFPAAALQAPMSKIMGKPYDVPNFTRHLYDFCEDKRGSILKKIGESRRVRFRFIDPLMQPFVIIHDYSEGELTNELLRQSAGRMQKADQIQSAV